MAVLLSVLLPPFFLMYVREKVLGNKIICGFHSTAGIFFREYALSLCFLQLVVLSVLCTIFHFQGAIDASLMENAGFAFRYLLLSLFVSAAEPFIEYFFRYHFKIELRRISLPRSRNLFLYAYALLLFLMNFVRIFDNSFWGDEGFTIKLAQMTVRQMIAATAADVHPPLYYLLAQLLYHLFGNNGAAYHLSALLPYAFILLVGCTAVKKIFGFIPSVVLITMASLMKNAVRYNVEVRMYALAAMFVLIAYIAFYKIIETNQLASWVVFCVASLGAAYTHYYALISVAFLFAMLLPMAIVNKCYLKGLIVSYLTTILAYLPWLSVLLHSFGRTANDWWLTWIPQISDCFEFLFDYKWLAVASFSCIAVYILYQLQLLKVKIADRGDLKERVDVRLCIPQNPAVSHELYWILSGLVSVCGTVAVGLALSYTIRPFFVTRYLFPMSSMLYLMFGFCVSKMNLRRGWSIALILAILLTNVPAYVQKFTADNNLDNEATKFLGAVRPESTAELVTNNSQLGWSLLCYYYPDNASKYDDNAPSQLDTDYNDIWLIWDGILDESAEANIWNQGYTATEVYEGYFADETYYRVYELRRNL